LRPCREDYSIRSGRVQSPDPRGLRRLYREKVVHNFETKRLTQDGRLLDIIIDGAIFYDENNQPAGQVITLRDVTQEKRTARINQALFRISQALYQFRTLDTRLEFITREVRQLLDVEGAMVILLDEITRNFSSARPSSTIWIPASA